MKLTSGLSALYVTQYFDQYTEFLKYVEKNKKELISKLSDEHLNQYNFSIMTDDLMGYTMVEPAVKRGKTLRMATKEKGTFFGASVPYDFYMRNTHETILLAVFIFMQEMNNIGYIPNKRHIDGYKITSRRLFYCGLFSKNIDTYFIQKMNVFISIYLKKFYSDVKSKKTGQIVENKN